MFKDILIYSWIKPMRSIANNFLPESMTTQSFEIYVLIFKEYVLIKSLN